MSWNYQNVGSLIKNSWKHRYLLLSSSVLWRKPVRSFSANCFFVENNTSSKLKYCLERNWVRCSSPKQSLPGSSDFKETQFQATSALQVKYGEPSSCLLWSWSPANAAAPSLTYNSWGCWSCLAGNCPREQQDIKFYFHVTMEIFAFLNYFLKFPFHRKCGNDGFSFQRAVNMSIFPL